MSKNRSLFIILTIIPSIITTILWGLSKYQNPIPVSQDVIYISQISGLLGLTLIVQDLVLAMKLRSFDDIFDGMDKMYRIHKIIGVSALSLIIVHLVLLVIHAIPDWTIVYYLLFPSTVWSYFYGVLAFYILVGLIFLSLYPILPYYWWKKTHGYLGLTIVFGGAHTYVIDSDVARYTPLRAWALILVAIGLVAFIYKKFLWGLFIRRYRYKVNYIRQAGDIVEIGLEPLSERLPFRAGQYVYIENVSDRKRREGHPFSIASHPGQDLLILSIKQAGDYTNKVNKLKEGEEIYVIGPYGVFAERHLQKTNNTEVWIAGGIGIAPFLGMLRNLIKTGARKQIFFYYTVSTREQTVYDAVILNLIKGIPNINYKLVVSKEVGRLTAKQIMADVANNKKISVFICGPQNLMESITDQFVELGLDRRHIIYEDFSFI